jgi:hypothetical protein
MKTLFTLLSLCAIGFTATATPADSLIIRIGKTSRVAIYAPSKEALKGITRYDLNQIVKDMVSRLDSVPEGQVYLIHEQDGTTYRRDSIAVVSKKKGNVTITINGRSNDTTNRDDDNDNDDDNNPSQEDRADRRERRDRRNNWRVGTDFLLGLNTWVNGPTDATYRGNSYELKPLGSRYFAVSFTQNPALVRSKSVKVSIRYGLVVAWNNFMFQNNIRLEREANNVGFITYPSQLEKSKLTICNLEIPVIPQFSIYNNSKHRAFNIGIGGFVGYRIDSYTRVKLQDGGNIRDHNSYFLNNLQYGIQGNIGVAGMNFFVKYHLTNTFQDGRGPAVRPLSFGITI